MFQVSDLKEDMVYCLDHGIELFEQKKLEAASCKLSFTYDDEELAQLNERLKSLIESKLQKKGKFAGMATLLK